MGQTPFTRNPPDSRPNWVSSRTETAERRVEAFPLLGPRETAIDRLAALVESQPRTTIGHRDDTSLHAVFVSLVFRFRDDVEFVLSDDRIDVLSASRLGHSDLGANRRRVERLREAWERQNAG